MHYAVHHVGSECTEVERSTGCTRTACANTHCARRLPFPNPNPSPSAPRLASSMSLPGSVLSLPSPRGVISMSLATSGMC
eukprot:scaffold104192_cov63-Phaeocystis_antarctica.AAC.4